MQSFSNPTMVSKKRQQEIDKLIKAAEEMALEDTVSTEDFLDAVKAITAFLHEMKAENKVEMDNIKTVSDKKIAKAQAVLDVEMPKIREKLTKEFGRLHKDQVEALKFIHDKVSSLRNGFDVDERKIIDSVLGEITIDEDDLEEKVKPIIEDFLEEMRKDITTLKARPIVSGSSGGVGGGHVKIYDLSASLDGSTKTFALPAFWRVLTVDLSSFPNALRPTVDYTVDGSLMKITFTSEIEAASSLATGQTCIITYAEA